MGHRRDDSKPAVKVTYQGIEIGYYEEDNQWSFELRGRSRTTATLATAKEAIDKPVADKKTVFQPVSAFKMDNWGASKFVPLKITSIIEGGHYCWTMIEANKGYRSSGRSKEQSAGLYLDTPENVLLIAEWKELDKQREEAYNKQQKLLKKMKTAVNLSQEVSE